MTHFFILTFNSLHVILNSLCSAIWIQPAHYPSHSPKYSVNDFDTFMGVLSDVLAELLLVLSSPSGANS